MLRKALLIWFFCLLAVAPLRATTYYVDETHGSASDLNAGTDPGAPWMTIGKCVTKPLVAGDICYVSGDTEYDVVVTISISGSAGNVITFRSANTCVTNTNTGDAADLTVNEGIGPRVRNFTLSGDYITVEGFEVTAEGMATFTSRGFEISGANNTLESVCVHDTGSDAIRYGGTAGNTTLSNVVVSHPRKTQVIYTTQGNIGRPTIDSSNNQFCVSVDGAAEDCASLDLGAGITGAAIASDIQANITGVTAVAGNDGKINIHPSTADVTATIVLTSGTTAQSPLGITVGGEMDGADFAWGIPVAPAACVAPACDGLKIINSRLEYGGDFVNPAGSVNVFRDVQFGPGFEYMAYHQDGIQNNGLSSNNLLDHVTYKNHNNYDCHMVLNQVDGSNNWIIRYSKTWNSCGNSFLGQTGQTMSGFYYYNNSYVNNIDAQLATGSLFGPCTGTFSGLYLRNNIFFNSTNPTGTAIWGSGCNTAVSGNHDYNLWVGVADPSETNDVNSDPLLTDENNGDFTLTASSPAIDQGGGPAADGGLTLANGAGSSTTALVVDNARWFQDWDTAPDTIDIGCDGNTVLISSIDSATGITLAAAKSWADNDPVCLYKNGAGTRLFYGTAPDMGAEEYLAPPNITSSSPLTSGDQDVAYSNTLTATSDDTLTWSVQSGSLPPGYTLNSSTGEIAGTCASYGTFNFTVLVTDVYGQTDSMAFQLVVDPTTPPPATPGAFLPFRR